MSGVYIHTKASKITQNHPRWSKLLRTFQFCRHNRHVPPESWLRNSNLWSMTDQAGTKLTHWIPLDRYLTILVSQWHIKTNLKPTRRPKFSTQLSSQTAIRIYASMFTTISYIRVYVFYCCHFPEKPTVPMYSFGKHTITSTLLCACACNEYNEPSATYLRKVPTPSIAE